MADSGTNNPVTEQPIARRSGDARLARALGRARWSIMWERLWPALARVATAVGLFLVLSWLGLWLWLPPIGRAIGVVLLVLLVAAALWPLLMVRMPSSMEGLRRLDRNTGLPHRPVTAIADDLAADASDSVSVALWRAHIERALRAAKTLKAGRPMPRLAARDPYAVRALVLVLFIATFFAAGDDRLRRITAAFDWQGAVAPANFRVDAWVSPPNYTGKPPIVLAGLRPGEPVQSATATLTVPAGSLLVIRASGGVHLDVATSGGLAEPETDGKEANHKEGNDKAKAVSSRPMPSSAGAEERRLVINESGSATVRSVVASDLIWHFNAIPDNPPTIALTKDPEWDAHGSLQLSYKVEDDYGVVGAQARFQLKDYEGTNHQPPRPLYESPEMPLSLPQARTKSGSSQTTKDLTEHPWAGAPVEMTLTARDEAGNEGSSAPSQLRLPERPFTKPTARALIEQRQ